VFVAPSRLKNTGRIATIEINERESPQNASTERRHAMFFQWRSSGRVTGRPFLLVRVIGEAITGIPAYK
jgi:hypothetical protein